MRPCCKDFSKHNSIVNGRQRLKFAMQVYRAHTAMRITTSNVERTPTTPAAHMQVVEMRLQCLGELVTSVTSLCSVGGEGRYTLPDPRCTTGSSGWSESKSESDSNRRARICSLERTIFQSSSEFCLTLKVLAVSLLGGLFHSVRRKTTAGEAPT